MNDTTLESLDEQTLLSWLIEEEAANHPVFGKMAVAASVFTRMFDYRWPSTVHEVILMDHAYEPVPYFEIAQLSKVSPESAQIAQMASAYPRIVSKACGEPTHFHASSIDWYFKDHPRMAFLYEVHPVNGVGDSHLFYFEEKEPWQS